MAIANTPPNVYRPGSSTSGVGDYLPEDWHHQNGFRSQHQGGVQFCFADAHVRLIHNDIELGLYRALATIKGNEQIEGKLTQ